LTIQEENADKEHSDGEDDSKEISHSKKVISFSKESSGSLSDSDEEGAKKEKPDRKNSDEFYDEVSGADDTDSDEDGTYYPDIDLTNFFTKDEVLTLISKETDKINENRDLLTKQAEQIDALKKEID
jgi:tryptophanyl-tRNA synthetase